MNLAWLRFLNPLHARKVERDLVQLQGDHDALRLSASTLADRTRALARETITLVDTAESKHAESRQAIAEAAVGITNMRNVLELIATDLACGKTSQAKTMVDALILVIEGPKT